MNYADGTLARLGDRVRIDHRRGVVVFSLDTDEFAPGYVKEDWSDLKRGVMVDFEAIGLIFYEDMEPDLEFVSRAPEPDHP
ncbi:hypothetical protein GCM10007301_53300 [Azorhizobium oxalatiphilum]|uniref:Uncharacterized protein n=1 Tax=Azorhizobium oxalatiphilum TaxID=980631 RepID=A0A917FJQ8_9HYPH|nr:hypothetical protein [Azorhizobium oxalatiphilum]GGF86729.1 hypothetical protein GCM10007301_53300 [Azorhizobium oxalatiphilum]